MTVYMVEQLFSRPDWEAEWNAFYDGNLKVLLAVPGFLTAQRFRNVGSAPRYMAMYTLESPAVFDTAVYIAAGGNGANSVRFREAYQIWIRNLFDTPAPVPDVGADQYLLVEDRADAGAPAAGVQCLKVSGMHKTTPYRCLSVLSAPPATLPANAICYRPITAQLGPLWT